MFNKLSSISQVGLLLATLPISTYVTEGLARIYGFKVLRHGTDLPSYFAILKSGG
ncbi:MAG: hypothetical protein K940chlam6_01734, partial [Chlamydiae bacterium]|nr:hypothetical protein [Chlamydiota bacterium]